MANPKNPDDFLAANPHLAEFMPFLDALNAESARGAVLVGCSFIDGQLEKILAAFLRDEKESAKLLSGFNAPLGSFAARITAAFALGLITRAEYAECETLRKVRNDFAHKVTASFEDQSVKDHCARLAYAAKPYGEVEVNARSQFTTAAVGLILHFTNRAHHVGQQQRREQSWPY